MAPTGVLRNLTLVLGAAVVVLGSLLFIAWKLYFRGTEPAGTWDSWELRELQERDPAGSTVRGSNPPPLGPGTQRRGCPSLGSPWGWGRARGGGSFPVVLKLLDLKSPPRAHLVGEGGLGWGYQWDPTGPSCVARGLGGQNPPVWEWMCGIWGPVGPFASVRLPSSLTLSCCSQAVWKQVLVLGLDGAGKSSVLHYICSQKARTRIPPTLGFNSAQLRVGGLEMDLLEGKAGPSFPVGTQHSPTLALTLPISHSGWQLQPAGVLAALPERCPRAGVRGGLGGQVTPADRTPGAAHAAG